MKYTKKEIAGFRYYQKLYDERKASIEKHIADIKKNTNGAYVPDYKLSPKIEDIDTYLAKWEEFKFRNPKDKNLPRRILQAQQGTTFYQSKQIYNYVKSHPEEFGIEVRDAKLTDIKHTKAQELSPAGKEQTIGQKALSDLNEQLKKQGVTNSFERQEIISEKVFGRKRRYSKNKWYYVDE